MAPRALKSELILAERAAAAGIDLQFTHVHLGRYISFRNEVKMDDLVRALDHALRELLGRDLPRFACVTHSTGGVLARSWIEAHYGASGLARCPLTRLILLAPPNHGSALAILGSGRISRLRSWFQGVEPGDVRHDHLEQVIDGAAQPVDLEDLRHRGRGAGKGREPGGFVLAGADRDERHRRKPQRRTVDQRHATANEARRFERPKPPVAGRGRNVETARDLVDRQVSLLLQQGEDAQRGTIDLHSGMIMSFNE